MADPLKGFDTSIDYYEVLQISTDATDGTIKKAYRRLALANHPDKLRDKSESELALAAANFLNITKAHELLSDLSKRAAYDKLWKARKERDIWKAQQNAQKRKLQTDLEELERQSSARSKRHAKQKSQFEAAVDDIREENLRTLNEIREQAETTAKVETPEKLKVPPIKLTWRKLEMTEELLRSLLVKKYGRLESVVVKKRKAVLLFEEMDSAILFMAKKAKDNMLVWVESANWITGEGEAQGSVPQVVRQYEVEQQVRLAKEQTTPKRTPTVPRSQPRKIVDEGKEADLLARLRRKCQTPV